MRACVLGLLVCAAAGCAGHRSPDATDLFIRGSQTTYHDGATFDAPGSKSSPSLPAQPTVPPDVPKSPQPKSSDSPTLESTHANLATELAALKHHPTAAGYIAVAEVYARLGVLDEAETDFARALHLDPHSAVASEGMARVWRDWGLPQFGLPYAYRAVSYAPRSASAENTLGTLLFALGDPAAAQDYFRSATERDPKAVYALNNLCYVSLMLGQGGPAVARCTEALALAPDLAPTRNNLALVYAAEGQDAQAANEFQRADSPSAAAFNIGIVHMARREYRQAIAPLESACRATPPVAGACAWAAQAAKLAAAPAGNDIRR